MKSKHLQVGFFLSILYLGLTWLCRENIFFGDMVQFGSRHPHFFFENNFSSIFLPNHLDSGHPPLFGIYIAFAWKLFGKSLVVSHFAMFPFLLIIAFQIPKFLSHWIKGSSLWIASLLVFMEPTLFAQATLTSPDIVLITFLLLSMNAYLNKKFILLSLFLIPLGLISLRGMMLLFSLFISTLIIRSTDSENTFLKKLFTSIIVFLPAASLASIWLLVHYQLTGWIGFHSDSPWATSFQQVGIFQMVKNIGLFVWRLVDFGRVSIWLLAVVVLIAGLRRKIFSSVQKDLLIILVVLIFIFLLNTIFADGLVGHRYYLPIYLVLLFFVLVSIQDLKSIQLKLIYALIAISFYLGGNYIYPSHVAMGWDATPAHLPYYQLRSEAVSFLDSKNIKLNEVGSGFPNLDSQEILTLNSDTSHFNSYANKNLKYILWSNVFNYPDSLINILELKEPVFSSSKRGVFVKIYELK